MGAGVGLTLVGLVGAATVIIPFEAETGVIQGNAGAVANATASGGTAVSFGSLRGFGFSAHILMQNDPAAYLKLATDAHATTLRDDFAWTDIEAKKGTFDWGGPDEIMRLTAHRGIRILAIADYSPQWASSCPAAQYSSMCGPVNAADYGNFAGRLAARYSKGGDYWKAHPELPYTPLSGIEIWNEPNIQNFWQNPSGDRYAQIVKSGYTAIKAADPTVMVLAGSSAPAGDVPGEYVAPVTFLKQLYDAGAGGYFDALSHHPYNYVAGKTADYLMGYQDWSAWSQMAETPESLRSVMTAHGDAAKKIWATEFGAPTNADGLSELEQGKLAAQALAKWKTYPWAGNFYWYTLHDDCTDAANRECFFGAVRNDNLPKPAYTSLKNAYAP